MRRSVAALRPVVADRSLAEIAYEKLKARIFDFELLPGDRFTESEIAERLSMSRTPARDALYRLEREGYLQVHLRVGWSVRAFDFRQFENSYDLRLILEEASVTRLCEEQERDGLDALKAAWLVPAAERLTSPKDVAAQDEAFLDGHWYTFDARNNTPRIGRVLIARGRDASDVALSNTFGPNTLAGFKVWTDEVVKA